MKHIIESISLILSIGILLLSAYMIYLCVAVDSEYDYIGVTLFGAIFGIQASIIYDKWKNR